MLGPGPRFLGRRMRPGRVSFLGTGGGAPAPVLGILAARVRTGPALRARVQDTPAAAARVRDGAALRTRLSDRPRVDP
jgi:hypothetical protein